MITVIIIILCLNHIYSLVQGETQKNSSDKIVCTVRIVRYIRGL